MAQHLTPLEKEFLIHQYKRNGSVKMPEFCAINNISTTSFRKWMKKYEEEGISGLARADSNAPSVLPEGVVPSEEAYKREILKLRIENERLKKNYLVRKDADGNKEFVLLRTRSSES